MRMRFGHRKAVLVGFALGFSLFVILPGILGSAERTEAPLLYPIVSHADWWQSQFGSSPQAWAAALGKEQQNRNSGPACVVMLINYKKRARISTDYHSFSDPRYPKIRSDARWKFSRANMDKGYPGGFPDNDEADVTKEELTAVLDHEDIPTTIYSGKDDVTIERIIEAVKRYSLVVCRVDPAAYFGDEKAGAGRWVVVYGFDEASVFINDPGRAEGKAKKVARGDFLRALHGAESGTNIVLLECVMLIGNYGDGWHADGRSRAFIEGYREFQKTIGFPADKGESMLVHAVGSCVVQDFEQPLNRPHFGKDGRSILFLNQAEMKVFLLKGDMLEKYLKIGAFEKLGKPTTNEYKATEGLRQDFEKGSLIRSGKDVLVKWTPPAKGSA